MNIEHIDLNLIKALVAIYEERQVTSAAERLGITQPGLSHALGRLRDLFDDELFVRRQGGMVPTAVAEDVYGRVRPGLRLLQESVEVPARVDPRTLDRTFVLGMNDYGAHILLPRLIHRIAVVAPAVRLKTRHYAHRTQFEDLRDGTIDLSITVTGGLPSWISQEILFEETALAVAAVDNPMIGERLTLDAYTACPHVIMAPDGSVRNWVDEILSELGRSRTVQHTLPHFLAIPPVVVGTNLITTTPRRIAEQLGKSDGLRTYELPFPVPPHHIVQAWRRRQDRNPVHRWLRGEVRAAAAEVA
ncbi:LysR family transcriptional regulator [Solirhodobacter olei]|uniref:LysR family transcriptional regulator n=1 Tax=Solirhodobacter olei TaxID=2493082 RepID=UPI0013E3D10D|nr:LysR family transcriptional regulator [Solirhodobacter olei]